MNEHELDGGSIIVGECARCGKDLLNPDEKHGEACHAPVGTVIYE